MGVAEISRLLDVQTDGLDALIAACENNPALQKIVEAEGTDGPSHLDRSQIEALSNAGMAVGFHTLHHEILTRLRDDELEASLIIGRGELERVVGRPLPHFAYPHGKAEPANGGQGTGRRLRGRMDRPAPADASPR